MENCMTNGTRQLLGTMEYFRAKVRKKQPLGIGYLLWGQNNVIRSSTGPGKQEEQEVGVGGSLHLDKSVVYSKSGD